MPTIQIRFRRGIGTILTGIGYVVLAGSLFFRPPKSSGNGNIASVDVVANNVWWSVAFLTIGLALVSLPLWRSKTVARTHGFAGTIVLCYGLSSLGSSLYNMTGITVAVFCYCLTISHYRTMVRKVVW